MVTILHAMDEPVEAWMPEPPVGGDNTRRLHAQLREAYAEIDRLRAGKAEAERLADHDALTGLMNRRGFLRELNRTLAGCRRYGTEASVVYLDLDGFKSVNDRFGHAAGDAALVSVARVLERGVRESDVAARLGGDEFAVILVQAGRAAALAKARRLAEAISAAPAGPGGRVQASWGVRTFEPGLQAEQMLAEADAAMFVRKGERRRA